MDLDTALPASSLRRIVGVTLSVASLAVILWSTLRSHPGSPVPSAAAQWSLFDVLINVLLFLPLGSGLAMTGFGALAAVAIGGVLSAGIELSQLWWVAGRYSSSFDVAANLTGTVVGIVLVSQWERRSRWWPQVARIVAVVVVICWFLGAACVAPAVPGPATWLVERPFSDGVGVPPGPRLLSASLQGTPLAAGPIPDVPALRTLLGSSDTTNVEATLLTGPTAGDSVRLLEIVVGEGFDPFLVLSQEGDRLLVHYRLRMTWLGIQGPSLRLEEGTSVSPGDTVHMSLVATPNELRFTSVRGSDVGESRLRLSPDLFLGAVFHRVTDGAVWWRLFPSMLSFLALGLALARRPGLLAIASGVALLLGPWLTGAAFPPWPVFLVALIGVVGGIKLARNLSLFPAALPESRAGSELLRNL